MDASSMRQNSSAPSGIQNSYELNPSKSQQISQQPPKRTKRFQNFQSVGGSLSLSFDTSALEDLLEVGKNEDEIEEEKRRKTINAIGLGRNVADMIATNRSGIEFFAPKYNKDDKQHKNQQEDKKNLPQNNGIKISKERGVEIEKIKKSEEKFLESRDFENEEDEEFWNGISALKTTKYGIATWCIAWNGAAMYLVSDRTGEFLINLLLGILGFWQAKRISKKQNFRKLLSLLTPTLIFIQTALMVLQRSALESFGAFS
uniref:Uncharacterized protein n=1 Tax=Meloidogyne javanica TaxID=6303 RepID=A0A915MVI0_MELJA